VNDNVRNTTTGHKTDHSNLRDIAGDMIGNCKVVSVAGLNLTATPFHYGESFDGWVFHQLS